MWVYFVRAGSLSARCIPHAAFKDADACSNELPYPDV